MKLTSLEEYGLRCLVELGRVGQGESLTIAEMSRREGISAPNVAKIMRILRRAAPGHEHTRPGRRLSAGAQARRDPRLRGAGRPGRTAVRLGLL